MNLHQLQYFQSVAENGQVTKAAKILHVSQPALSMALSSLEEEIGLPLFKKNGRLLELTKYGTIFLKHISKALHEIELAKLETAQLALFDNQTINIASTYSLSISLIPEIVKNFTVQNPNTVFRLKQGPNLDLIKDLGKAETDFVFGRIIPGQDLHMDIKYIPLYSEDLVILTHSNHPLANRKEINMEELKDEYFIFFHESTGYNMIVTELLSTLSFKPKVRYEVYDNATCTALISENQGIALVVPSPHYDSKTIHQIKIKAPNNFNKTNVCLIWNKNTEQNASNLYRQFLDYVFTQYRDPYYNY
ncbi:LysR family transcriptional regulator [Clostridiaceae bacterium 35-E11]